MPRASWLPATLLLAYGVAFAARALGVTPLAFDDHPGQLARLWHVAREGPAPWAWNAGWWAGYPEMQFYPPGWFYLGAALSWATFGALAPPIVYQLSLWMTYLAPGLTAFLLLRRLLGDGWRALPGAFVVLTFAGSPAGGAASGVEGGVRIGMVAARFAWALLPLLSLTLVRWIEGGGRFPRAAVGLVAAIVLTHPAHAPAAIAILAGAAFAMPAWRRAIAQVAGALAAAALLVAFWLVPLLHHVEHTRALAWGGLASSDFAGPLSAALLALAMVAVWHRRAGPWTAALNAVWLAALVVAIDAAIVEPLGARFLPADRVADGAWMTALLASGLGAGVAVDAVPRRLARPVAALALLGVLVALSLPNGALTLWARAADWPSLATVTRGLRLDDLWRALGSAPPGRVLFVRSGVPLVYGTAWYRPHTHVTALAPLLTGREMLGGTFTHGAPVAALVYRGDAGTAPLMQLAERLDGESLFGRPLATLDATTFEAHARRFRISTVVALEDDAPRLPFMADNPRYRRLAVPPPFLVFVATEARLPAQRAGAGSWDVAVRGVAGEWVSTSLAYYPLWRAETDGRPLATRRGQHADLEVRLEAPAATVRLTYGPALAEVAGLAISVAALAGLSADAWRRRRRTRAGTGVAPGNDDGAGVA